MSTKKQFSGWFLVRNLILAAGLILILLPLWLVLINSFKTLEEAGKNFFALPSGLNFANYQELFSNSNYWVFLKNSFVITVFSLALILIFIPSVSYAIARNYEKRYYKFVYFYLLMGLFIPEHLLHIHINTYLNHTKPIIMNSWRCFWQKRKKVQTNENTLFVFYPALSLFMCHLFIRIHTKRFSKY